MAVAQWGPTHYAVQVGNAGGRDVVISSSPDRQQQQRRGGGAPDAAASAGEPDVGALLAAPVTREQLALLRRAAAAEHSSALTRLVTLVAAPAGSSSDADGYWVPQPARGECGLLETFVKRRRVANGVALDGVEYPLVYSRPHDELSLNFSNQRGERVDLTLDRFKLSKATLALNGVAAMDDDASLRGRDIKQGLQHQLPHMTTDEYYLVAYRDYSAFATRTFSADARRASLMAPKYVERWFAVRVGQSAGVFVPISESQFVRGWELITAADLAPGATQRRCYLTADQFRSLGTGPDELMRDPEAIAEEQRRLAAALAAGPYGAGGPSAWDFTPTAIKWRLTNFLDQQYRSVGRVVLKVTVVAGGVLLIRYALSQSDAASHGSSRGGRARRRRVIDDRTVFEALGDAVATASPLSMVDYMMGR